MLNLTEVTNRLYELMEGKAAVKFGLSRNKYQRYLLDPLTAPPANLKKDHYYIQWGFPSPVDGMPYNQQDPMRLMKVNFTVYLYIPMTGMVGQASENTLYSLIRRYSEDITDIVECLCYHENHGDVSSQVVSITSTRETTASEENGVLILEIPFETQQWVVVGIDSSWLPTQIADLYAWYRSDDVTLVSNKVSQLNDKSGNGRHATQTTAGNRPTYSATGGLNNLPYFSTTESYSTGTGLFAGTTGTWNFLHDGTGATVFVVAKTTGLYWLWLLGTHQNSVTEVGYSISSTSDPGNVFSCNVGNGSGVVSGFWLNSFVVDPSKYHKWITTFKTAPSYEDAFWMKVDNKQLGTPIIRTPSTSNSGKLGIGFGGSGLYPATSQFHEIIIFNRKLSPDEIRVVEAYLNNRYGI